MSLGTAIFLPKLATRILRYSRNAPADGFVGLAEDRSILSGVENRRSSGSLPVAFVSAAFAERASIRFGIALFPVPAHRSGQADFPHPALGESSRFRPRKARGPFSKTDQAQYVIEGRGRESFSSRPRYLMLGT